MGTLPSAGYGCPLTGKRSNMRYDRFGPRPARRTPTHFVAPYAAHDGIRFSATELASIRPPIHTNHRLIRFQPAAHSHVGDFNRRTRHGSCVVFDRRDPSASRWHFAQQPLRHVEGRRPSERRHRLPPLHIGGGDCCAHHRFHDIDQPISGCGTVTAPSG